MNAYLFLWNPAQDPGSFREYDRALRRTTGRRPYAVRWRCPSTRPRSGDIALLQRTGKHHNGVFAIGVVSRKPYERHKTRFVDLALTSFLPIGSEIPRDEITTAASNSRSWAPQASGTRLPEPIYRVIRRLWHTRAFNKAGNRSASVQQASLPEELQFLEGKRFKRMVAHRTRETRLRNLKIKSVLRECGGRLACEVPRCGFDFQRVYGALGAHYAHVHHLRPLSSYGRAETTRLSDLAIVCANCHAMIHRGGACRALPSLIPRPHR